MEQRSDDLNKGKWVVGETKQYQGKTYQVSGFNAKNAPLWKLVKNGDKPQQQSTTQPQAKQEQKKDDVTEKKTTVTPKPTEKPKQQKTEEGTVSEGYNAPKPTVTSKNEKAFDEAPFYVPEKFMVGDKIYNRDKVRSVYADKTKTPDSSLLKMINNKGKHGEGNNENFVQLALEEAQHRGITEDKIDIDDNSRIKRVWNNLKRKYDSTHRKDDDDVPEEEREGLDLSLLGNMDVEEFLNKFEDGDKSYFDKSDERVKKEFNNFTTLRDRQRYDVFTDLMNRKDPYYEGPKSQLFDLNSTLASFFEDRRPEAVPVMISAGGAGAGKTSGMLKVADFSNLEIFDPDKGHQPGDGNYDIYITSDDVDSDVDFRELLTKHNGKIIVFDDKDKLLITKSGKLISLMKSIADGNPKMRIFQDSGGNEQKFTGKLLFVTNKSMDTLNKDEDHKAIMSRTIKHDIHLTVNETLALLKDRYKTMGPNLEDLVTPKEEQDIRKEIYETMLFDKENLDPSKFTVRKFIECLEHVRKNLVKNQKIDKDPTASDTFGKKKDWRVGLREIFNKAIDFEGADLIEKAVELNDETRKKFLKLYKKDPKKFKELFGKRLTEEMKNNGKEIEIDVEVEKAIESDFSMDYSEALSILGLQ